MKLYTVSLMLLLAMLPYATAEATTCGTDSAIKCKEKVRNRGETTWHFFPICLETHDAKKRTLVQQAELLRELGCEGYAHRMFPNVEKRVKTLSDAGLRLFMVLLDVDLSEPQPLDEKRLAEILPSLKNFKPQLALPIKGGKPSDRKLDDKAVALINRIADMAKPYGVTVVLYPHSGIWLETTSDAVRIAKKVNRPNEVGVMFNLSHWMKADSNRDIRSVLKEARPWLKAVTLNGSDTPQQIRNNKGNWIQPLGSGSYDITILLDALREINYTGIIGLQCWGIGGDARVHLTQSMAAWKKLMKKYKLHQSNAPVTGKRK